jgi:hypothetical protein
MGKIERFEAAGWQAFRVPASEEALVDATLALQATGAAGQHRLALAVQSDAFRNPSDTDLASYGEAWFG